MFLLPPLPPMRHTKQSPNIVNAQTRLRTNEKYCSRSVMMSRDLSVRLSVRVNTLIATVHVLRTCPLFSLSLLSSSNAFLEKMEAGRKFPPILSSRLFRHHVQSVNDKHLGVFFLYFLRFRLYNFLIFSCEHE